MKYLLVIALFHVGVVAAEDTVTSKEAVMEQICRNSLCREPAPIRLKLKDGKQFETVPRGPTPIVSGSFVTVYPGETVHIEGELKDGRLINLRAVPKVSNADTTLTFHLEQDASDTGRADMFLTVMSPFEGALKYRLGIMLPSSDRLFKTSACPLKGGIQSIEHWPYPIFQVVATYFRVVPAGSAEAGTCE